METVYEDEEVVITKLSGGVVVGHSTEVVETYQYLIQSKKDAHKRQGKGYLLLSPGAMQRMCNALQGRAW